MHRTKFIFIWAWCLSLSCDIRAGEFGSELYPCPVTIKVVQVIDPKRDVAQVQVQNISKTPIIVDRQGFEGPDFQVSRAGEVTADGVSNSIHTGSMHGSVGGRWSLAQLQRREPKRLVTVSPGQTFTAEVEVNTLLGGISPEFPHGNTQVTFTFHDFLMAVDGKETDEDTFKAGVKPDEVAINRR